MDSIFKDKTEEEGVSVIDLEILVVLVIKLLRQGLNRLVNEIEPVEL
jgi:cobalamin biosynthesis protein CbiG